MGAGTEERQLESPLAESAPSVVSALSEQAAIRANKPFLTYRDDHVTFADAERRSASLASGLAGAGVTKGAFVGVFMRNSIDFVTAMLASAQLGAVAVPINTDYRGALLTNVLAGAGPILVVTDTELLPTLLEARAGTPVETVVVRGEPPRRGGGYGSDLLAFRELSESPPLAEPFVGEESDLLLIQYTGGTTGPSKGVMVGNGLCLRFARDWINLLRFTDDDVLYGPLPLFHALAYQLGVVSSLLTGGHMHIDDRFSASAFWREVNRVDATVAHVIFSIIPILLSRPADPLDRSHRLKAAYVGPSRLSAAFEERFGCPVLEMSGQTETGMVMFPPHGLVVPPGSCGKLNPLWEARLVDDDGRDVADGEAGELVARPKVENIMFQGYLNQADHTVATWRDLWHHSGDRYRRDSEGWYYFADRTKDTIRRHGENISAHELELGILEHPAIAECAAVPVPSDLEEDEVMVWVVLASEGAASAEDIHAFCVETLPRFMVPRYITLTDELPKTRSQKIRKDALRAHGVTEASWDARNHASEASQRDG